MRTERYVNAIVGKVKCGRARRHEIRQQLLADIAAAEEGGETPEEIMARMGSARDVAAEFNRNLSEEEQKRYRRTRLLRIAAAAAALLLVCVCAARYFLPRQIPLERLGTTEEEVAAQMRFVVEELEAGGFETLRANAIEEMQPFLCEEEYERAKAQIADDWGALEHCGTPYIVGIAQSGGYFAVGEMNVTYEKVSVTYRLTFDEELRLAGLYLR